ncbi:hypothetical protein N7495_001114 [Penicillium taxi]|uniref:uncharacterized protein n=1 Tax=Penicillium taxi TaxID=168475 RepID=UPI00254576D3|nr:uncharacterized protein N7495_001114 [Penicillium taxi]KAJ5908432.1 hypothetical protein N7495_001114 [Penicillium taxi]
MTDEATKILVKYNIEFKSIDTLGPMSKVNPGLEPSPTVFVVLSKDFSSEALYRAAKDIYRNLRDTFPGITIELIKEKLDLHPSCYPVSSSKSIFNKWHSISDEIVGSCQMDDWTALELWHYGVDAETTRNPITVLVRIKEQSTKKFFTSTQKIIGILAMNQEPDVQVLFIKNNMRKLVEGPELHWKTCRKQVLPGVSIGIHNCSTGSSTLGGNVELRWANSPKWRMYALTCFHAVYPPREGSHRDNLPRIKDSEIALKIWKFSPVWPNFTKDPSPEQKLLRIDHPSRKDISRSIEMKKAELEESLKDQSFQELFKRDKSIQ